MIKNNLQTIILSVIAVSLIALTSGVGILAYFTYKNGSHPNEKVLSDNTTPTQISEVSTSPTVTAQPQFKSSTTQVNKAATPTQAPKKDYSYQIGWLNTLIKGANDYINIDSKKLYADVITQYDQCNAGWDKLAQEYPNTDYTSYKAQCTLYRDNGNSRIDGDVNMFKYRIPQYNYLLGKFQAGNPNEADLGLYNEIVTKGR